jgi:hypothetical protein
MPSAPVFVPFTLRLLQLFTFSLSSLQFSPSPCSRLLLDTVVVVQLVRKPKVHYVFTRASSSESDQSSPHLRLIPVRTVWIISSYLYLNIPIGLAGSTFLIKIVCVFSQLSCTLRVACSSHLIPLDFVGLILICLDKSANHEALCYYLYFRFNYTPEHPVLKHSFLCTCNIKILWE